MEQAVEELFASGTVTPMADAMAIIEDIGADEVRAVFEQMLANPRRSRSRARVPAQEPCGS